MRGIYGFAICTLLLVTGCGGGGSHDSPAPPPAPTIALAATASSAMQNGASVQIRTTLTGLAGPVTWSFTPAAAGVLSDFPDNSVATFSAARDAIPAAVTITASAGGVSQSIQLALKPSPELVPYLDLPHVWTIGPDGVGFHLTGGNPLASAADQSGNLYLAYSAPVSEIKKVGVDGSITTFALVDHPGSLAFGPDGVLYVVDMLGNMAYAIRRIAPDGTMLSTLTQTAPFDVAQGTIDGPSGVATAVGLRIGVSPAGVIYATDASRVRKIAPDGSFSTFAGGGCEVFAGLTTSCGALHNPVDAHGTEARFIDPADFVFDAAGNLYVSDYSLIRKITAAGDVSTLAGSLVLSDSYYWDVDGTGSAARISGGGPIAIDSAGNLYKQTGGSQGLLRKITPSGVVSTVATGVYYDPMAPYQNIVSLYAGIPGYVVLQTTAALIKVKVD